MRITSCSMKYAPSPWAGVRAASVCSGRWPDVPLWAITRGDWDLSSCPKIPVFHKIKVRKTSIIHFFILCFISWCEKGDSNPKPLLHKPCNCKPWGAQTPICMHFCMHSESIYPYNLLEIAAPVSRVSSPLRSEYRAVLAASL